MKVSNLQNINYRSIIFSGKNKTSKPFNLRQLKADVFQRTISKTEKVNHVKTEKEINKLYDEAFDFVATHMPIIKEMEAERPKLVFRSNMDATAAYDFPQNIIELNSSLKEDMFAFQIFDSYNDIVDCFVCTKRKMKKITAQLETESTNYKIIKLNPEEKTLCVTSALAHELRHWAQEHILVSTQGCQEPYQHKLDTVNEIIDSIQEILDYSEKYKLSSKDIRTYRKKLEEVKKQYSYILNYKPQIIFDEKQKLPLSIIPWGAQYWSIKDHFLPAALSYSNSNESEYSTNASEIDAYYFQSEYIIYNNKEKNSSVREEVLQAILYDNIRKGFFASEKIEEFGYPPLLED